MKRHASLVPLAREHHGGLILAQLLKKNASPYKGMPESIEDKSTYAFAFFNSDLIPHFTAEEKVFASLVNINPELDEKMKVVMEEHVALKKLFSGLQSQRPDAGYLDEIGQALEKHIRKEDRELFPMIEAVVDEATMLSIAQLLNH
jgi:Hemerythrin HHE cation binding domain